MIRKGWVVGLLAALGLFPLVASAGAAAVEIWTDRGADAVYEPGERVQIKARSTDDAYLLVYDIDAEGYLHVLFPYRDQSGFVEARQTFRIPDEQSADELVVQGPVGQGYIVAIASRDPLRDLPWYLRPYNPQGEGVGYVGQPDEEEGVTSEGRIVGDPFVAMERIRRRVLNDPEDRGAFATAYVSYYVHDRVRYPRYVCYDCHRPAQWAWWDGFDPYYTSCSAFSFRVNWGWYWGPSYWFGNVPYYVYVVRPDCPPYYRQRIGTCYSSWDGWPRWTALWGTHLVRYKSPPPVGYVPPTRYKWDPRGRGVRPAPPGILTAAEIRGQRVAARMPVSRGPESPVVPRGDWRPGGELRKPVVARGPATETPRGEGGGWGAGGLGQGRGRGRERSPSFEPPRREETPGTPRREDRPRQRSEPPRTWDPRGGDAQPVTPRRDDRPQQRNEPPGQWDRRGGEASPVTPRHEDRPRQRSEPPSPRGGEPRPEYRPRQNSAPPGASRHEDRPRQRYEPPRSSSPRGDRSGSPGRGDRSHRQSSQRGEKEKHGGKD